MSVLGRGQEGWREGGDGGRPGLVDLIGRPAPDLTPAQAFPADIGSAPSAEPAAGPAGSTRSQWAGRTVLGVTVHHDDADAAVLRIGRFAAVERLAAARPCTRSTRSSSGRRPPARDARRWPGRRQFPVAVAGAAGGEGLRVGVAFQRQPLGTSSSTSPIARSSSRMYGLTTALPESNIGRDSSSTIWMRRPSRVMSSLICEANWASWRFLQLGGNCSLSSCSRPPRPGAARRAAPAG